MAFVHISKANKLGRTRSEVAKNLKSVGWGSGLTEAQEDKARFIEKKYDLRHGQLRAIDIDKYKG